MEKVWLKHYPAGVPAEVKTDVYPSLVSLLEESFRKYRDLPAYIFMGKRFSFGQVDDLSRAFAGWLQSQGLARGDRVAIMMPNAPQYVIAELGIWKAGGIVASINPLYTGAELEHMFRECDAETVVTMSLFYDKVKEVQAKTPLKRVIVANIKHKRRRYVAVQVVGSQITANIDRTGRHFADTQFVSQLKLAGCEFVRYIKDAQLATMTRKRGCVVAISISGFACHF